MAIKKFMTICICCSALTAAILLISFHILRKDSVKKRYIYVNFHSSLKGGSYYFILDNKTIIAGEIYEDSIYKSYPQLGWITNILFEQDDYDVLMILTYTNKIFYLEIPSEELKYDRMIFANLNEDEIIFLHTNEDDEFLIQEWSRSGVILKGLPRTIFGKEE